MKFNIYVAECDVNGGITHSVLDEEGKLKFCDFMPCDRPMYLAIANNRIYTLIRYINKDSKLSGLITNSILKEGRLGLTDNSVLSTKGEVACHLCITDEAVYAVNYISGSVIKFPDKLVKQIGKGPNIKRQESSHTHFICETPDKKYICVNDLGADKIVVYDKQLNKIRDISMPSGFGPRHLAFSENGEFAYCVNELDSSVTVLKYKMGDFNLCNSYSTLPQSYRGQNTAAAIRCVKDEVYASNRGANTVCVFKALGDKLTKVTEFNCGGESPRDINVIGNFIVCTNETSNNVTVFKKYNNNYIMTDNVKAKSPLCVVFTAIE